MPASLKQNFIDSEGKPAQCFILRILSSSIALIILPSFIRQADESPWYAFKPSMYKLVSLLISLIEIYE